MHAHALSMIFVDFKNLWGFSVPETRMGTKMVYRVDVCIDSGQPFKNGRAKSQISHVSTERDAY